MKFSFSDDECRCKLWRMHLHKKIPGAKDINTEILAKRYKFTGGQIALVVHNACAEAITRSDEKQRLKWEDIAKYAELELPWQKVGLWGEVGF